MADEFAQTGTIISVEEKHLTRKSDNQPFTLYKIRTDSLGELSTTKRDLFLQAQALEGQGVLLTYTEKPASDPSYPPNRYLNRINLAANVQQAIPQGAEAPQVPYSGQPPADGQSAGVSQPLQNVSIGRDEAIWRQTATKTAASFNNKDLAEYWQRVEMLMSFYRTGVVPGVAQTDAPHESFLPSPATVMPSENTFVPPAPGDEGYMPSGAGAISDDDIPF